VRRFGTPPEAEWSMAAGIGVLLELGGIAIADPFR
jgi:hypothetical protein